jgi:UDPglucose 6-dehydrogenase
LKEFELLNDLNKLNDRSDIDLAVICCPWPQYRDLKFSPATKVLPTWQL